MAQPPGPENHDDAGRLLRQVDAVVGELRPGARLQAGLDSLLDRDLGLDSLARVELLARVEREFEVQLPSEVLGEALTPREVLAAVVSAGYRPRPAAPDEARMAAPARADGLPEAAPRLIDVLEWHVARHPERTHVSFYRTPDATEPLSYGQLAEAAGSIAAALTAAGVRPGACVALMLPSGLDFFRCFFGILMAGAVPVPMYPPSRPAQLEDHLNRQAGILRNCEAPVLITFDQVRPLARMLTGLSPSLRTVLTPADLDAPPMAPVATDAEDLALIQYTSGSTGDPKGVMLSHRNLLANIRAWGRAVGLGSTDVAVSWLPLYHDMGLIGAWLGSLYHGCPLVLMSPLDFLARPERWLWAIHRHRGTVTAAPNFAFALCVKRLADKTLDGLDLSSWRLAANGAEPVNADTLDRFAQTFARYGLRPEALAPVYGLAEATVGLCVPPPGRGVRIDRVAPEPMRTRGLAEPVPDSAEALRFIACGQPLPDHSLRVVDGDGRALPERRVGRLEFRGPSATRGYYRNPAASAKLFDGDWLVTGDYAYLADGELYITGREKDLIIRGGRNFYPYDLEQAVGELAGVRKGCVAVFGVVDVQAADEQLVVVAETRETDAERRAALEQRIAGAAVEQIGIPPDVVVLALPHSVLKTSSGKLRRAAVREAYLNDTLGASTRPPWLQVLRLQTASLAGQLRGLARRAGGWCYGAWVWAAFWLLAPLAALAIFVLPSVGARWRATHRLARAFQTLSGCPMTVSGLDNLPDGPVLLVANHASYADGLVLGAALPSPVAFVAKGEFKGNPVMRPLFERMGAHFVSRFDSRQGVGDLKRLGDIARQPPPLLFFAEGTFGSSPGLRGFRLGAFQIAAQHGLPVVPVAIAGTRQVLPAGSWRPRRGPLRVTVCPPVSPQGEGWHDMLELRDAVRQAILAHCGEPDAGGG
ncbi:AMP-binding protein [Denitromonas iodatirespirans]|uniref:AMP-binding protein n=1 Tax=Denitromonas iodatirespirans TaxID=2795389 RepID=A0A944H8L5_DENI1|nr:AMP-binding protein [Denitromonas iodatirespirans]MBT0961510.1 AMP-binding protein [Denitromonas iodatirespirans]